MIYHISQTNDDAYFRDVVLTMALESYAGETWMASWEFDKDNGFTVLDAGQVNDRGVDDILAQVKQIVGDMPVYLTFDIDCLDPAFAPGTGTPVIGGLTSDRAIKLVRGLKDLNIVGMDVVEVAPAYDQSEITALAAATLALEMLYIQAAKKGE